MNKKKQRAEPAGCFGLFIFQNLLSVGNDTPAFKPLPVNNKTAPLQERSNTLSVE